MKRASWSPATRLAAGMAFGAAVLGVCLPAQANTYNVATTADLVAAVNDANTIPGPHVINLAPGLYQPGALSLTREITLNGSPAPPAR